MFLLFSGSGGAIVGLLPDPSRFEELRKAYEGEGFVVTRVRPNIPGGKDSKATVDEEEVALTNKGNSSSSNTSDVKGSDSSSSNSDGSGWKKSGSGRAGLRKIASGRRAFGPSPKFSIE